MLASGPSRKCKVAYGPGGCWGGRALFEPKSMGAEGWWSVDDNLTTALTSSGFERRTETTKAVTRKDDGLPLLAQLREPRKPCLGTHEIVGVMRVVVV